MELVNKRFDWKKKQNIGLSFGNYTEFLWSFSKLSVVQIGDLPTWSDFFLPIGTTFSYVQRGICKLTQITHMLFLFHLNYLLVFFLKMWLGIFKKVSFSIDEIQLELQVCKEQKKTNKLALITKNTKKNEIKSKFKKIVNDFQIKEMS